MSATTTNNLCKFSFSIRESKTKDQSRNNNKGRKNTTTFYFHFLIPPFLTPTSHISAILQKLPQCILQAITIIFPFPLSYFQAPDIPNDSGGSLVELSKPVTDVLFEQGLVILVPPTESRTALRDITSRPHDSELINLTSGFVVWAEDIECTFTETVELCGAVVESDSDGQLKESFGYQGCYIGRTI